ncbi:MAG: proline racemase [Asgard group archaeon]|nr:proline racemase [Asgard group archaeon]
MKDFGKRKSKLKDWHPPDNWLKITTIEAHSAGEPLRIILRGFPKLDGKTILEKRKFAKENYDHLRTALMWEPRGHADMYGCLITESVAPADFGVLFLHNEGFSTMCGHGIITITKVVLETGFLPIKSPVTKIMIDTPAGLVTSYAKIEDKKVKSVYFHNVPSFVLALDNVVDVPGLGEIQYDVAFGGAFYAFVKAEDAGVSLTPKDFQQLIKKGMAIKKAVMDSLTIEHPFEKDLNFLYGTIFIGEPFSVKADSRNVCIFAEGEVDRCPTGTGVSARMALHYKRKEIDINEPMVIESIIGTRYIGSVVKTTKFGSFDAVIPQVDGTAHITGKSEFLIDPEDPLKDGFILR